MKRGIILTEFFAFTIFWRYWSWVFRKRQSFRRKIKLKKFNRNSQHIFIHISFDCLQNGLCTIFYSPLGLSPYVCTYFDGPDSASPSWILRLIMAVLGVTKSSKFGDESSITVTKTTSSFFFGARQLPLNDTVTRRNRLENRRLLLKKAKICRKWWQKWSLLCKSSWWRHCPAASAARSPVCDVIMAHTEKMIHSHKISWWNEILCSF